MQNVGLPKSLDTNLNTAGSEVELRRIEQPLLRKALSDHFGISLQTDNEDDEVLTSATQLVQQASEEVPKVKTRSRFTSAFRSFRGSKPSKKKVTSVSTDTVVSSGGEEAPDTVLTAADSAEVKKKKTRLTKKFSLSAIKRNKVQPKKGDVSPANLVLVTSSTQTTQTLDRRPIFTTDDETKRKVTVTTTTPTSTPLQSPESSPTKFDKVRKIQITIQGKKIEHTSNNSSQQQQSRKNLPTTTTEITGSAPPSPTTVDDGDYLTAVEDTRQQKPSSTPFRRNSKKRQKSKTKSNSPPSTPPHNSPSYCKSITSTISTTTTTEDKFVVTQSICDTPPQERAPAKPSRATTSLHLQTVSPPPAASTIRKSLSHQIPKLRRQRLHVAESADTEPHFMIREGTIERGRRFPRPSSIDTQDPSASASVQSPPLPTPLGTPDIHPVSTIGTTVTTATTPTTTTSSIADEAESKSLPTFVEETKESQDTVVTQPREPLSLPTLASTITSRVEIERASTTDTQATSSNEPFRFAGNNILNPNLSGSISNQPLEGKDDSSTVREQHSIRFEVGTPVRPQRTSVLLSQVTVDSKDFSSIGSNRSSVSDQSLVSESSFHRRKIQYIDQPSVYTEEERDILDGKKEALSYLSGISEYSFDSEFSVETPMPAFGDLTMEQEDPPIMTSSTEKREHLYKILVIGELGTGKTSFIKRYVHQFFSQNYRATIGVDFALKVLHWDANTIVRLQLWDIAGQERFGNMTRVYYKEAVGAFIVFDVTRSGTFDCVSKWKEDLDSKVQLPDGSRIPCILLANKCDQDKQGIVTTPEKMDEYVKDNGFAGWFETSAKENINIDEAARALVNKILLNDKLISAADIADSEKFNLSSSNDSQDTTQSIRSKCSC